MLLWLFPALGLFIFLLLITFRHNSFYRYLFELESIFEQAPTFKAVSKYFLTSMIEETGSDAGIIYYFDEVRNNLTPRTLCEVRAEEIHAITQTLKERTGIFETILKDPTYLTPRILKAQACGVTEVAGGFYKNMLISSLVPHGHILGVTVLLKRKSRFTWENLKLLRLFSPRAAVWLENARLYQLATDTTKENAKLYIDLYRLHDQATRDELTGLFNRHMLREELKKSLRLEKPLSLILTDLDYFKVINDDFGHHVGDQVLKEFGALLQSQLRGTDKAYRYGGEEFMIILPQTELDAAVMIAERLREKVASFKFCDSSGGVKITASFGVNSYPVAPGVFPNLTAETLDPEIEKLIRGADEALYQAKSAGRNQVKSHQST